MTPSKTLTLRDGRRLDCGPVTVERQDGAAIYVEPVRLDGVVIGYVRTVHHATGERAVSTLEAPPADPRGMRQQAVTRRDYEWLAHAHRFRQTLGAYQDRYMAPEGELD